MWARRPGATGWSWGSRAGRDDCVYTQIAYNRKMKAVFVELPAFERHRENYLDDRGFSALQRDLMKNPEAGEVIEGTGGLRKMLKAMIKAELDSRRTA